MANLNHVTLSGNIVRDADLKSTTTGLAVCSFSIAVKERVKNRQTNQWEEKPSFFNCVLFGTFAEAMNRHLTKGKKIAIGGRLKQTTWQTKDGETRHGVNIIVDTIESMANSRTTTQDSTSYQQQEGTPSQMHLPTNTDTKATNDLYDEDIPF